MESRAEEAYELKHLIVCHCENSQALNLPPCLYSNVKGHLKSNDFCSYINFKASVGTDAVHGTGQTKSQNSPH